MPTDRESYLFAVRTGEDGKPFIALEPIRGHLPVLGHGQLRLEMTEDTTANQVEDLARLLNSTVLSVGYTG